MIRIAGALFILIVERIIAHSVELDLWQWIGIQTVLFSMVPLLFILTLRIKRDEIGLSVGDLRLGLKYVFVMLFFAMPLMIYGAGLPAFKAYYPIWAPARSSLSNFILFELAILVMMFNTEFFFRGLLLFGFERVTKDLKGGKGIAILAHSVIYMLVHVGKPELEVLYSFFVGIVFGWVALKTKSILPSFIAHWTSSVIFDILIVII
ncbi:MAG: type II CAAX prenyl endopeptidase Rce1 family protein [Candidatus Hydrothermarchaeales archaeon]